MKQRQLINQNVVEEVPFPAIALFSQCSVEKSIFLKLHPPELHSTYFRYLISNYPKLTVLWYRISQSFITLYQFVPALSFTLVHSLWEQGGDPQKITSYME